MRKFVDFLCLCGLATFLAFGLVILMGVIGAKAQDETPTVGKGLVCDTAEQIEQWIELSKTMGPQEAADKINEERKPVPCGLAQVAYVGREDGKVVQYKGDFFAISKIIVVGGFAAGVVIHVPPTVQYTLFPAKGHGI